MGYIKINAIRLGNSCGCKKGDRGDMGEIPSYTHVQSMPAMVWNVQHNFGTADELLVFVRDAEGNLVWCEADYPSSTMNLLVLRFGVSMAGTATVKWLVVSG